MTTTASSPKPQDRPSSNASKEKHVTLTTHLRRRNSHDRRTTSIPFEAHCTGDVIVRSPFDTKKKNPVRLVDPTLLRATCFPRVGRAKLHEVRHTQSRRPTAHRSSVAENHAHEIRINAASKFLTNSLAITLGHVEVITLPLRNVVANHFNKI